jgi:hypothetical protein
MNYYQSLTAELRYRSTPEKDIADILAEVRAHTPAGEDPAEHFGTPAEYAEQYTAALPARKRQPHPVRLILTLSAVAYIVFAFLAKPLLGIDVRDYVGPVMLWPALALVITGITISFLTTTFKRAPTTNSH